MIVDSAGVIVVGSCCAVATNVVVVVVVVGDIGAADAHLVEEREKRDGG